MTQTSYNNYISNMAYMHSLLGAEYASALKLGKCSRDKLGADIAISDAIMTVLADWDLEPEDISTATYSVTGLLGVIGVTSYLVVADSESDIGHFSTGDTVTISDGVSVSEEDTIADIVYIAGYRYYEFASFIPSFGTSYTMSKSVESSVETNNHLTVDQMKGLADVMNKIHSTHYCVDFILT